MIYFVGWILLCAVVAFFVVERLKAIDEYNKPDFIDPDDD